MKTLTSRSLATRVLLASALTWGLGAVSVVEAKQATPDGFRKFLVYMGTGVYDPSNSNPRPGITDCQGIFCDGDYFQKVIMHRSDEEVAALTRRARAFYLKRFGIDVDDPANEGRVTFTMFTLNPDFEYRLYSISGQEAPKEGWVVRDGGYKLEVIDPHGIDLGGELSGTHAPAGSVMFFGHYNILVTDRSDTSKDEIIIHYRSRAPGLVRPGSFTFQCDLTHEKWGAGLAMGTESGIPLKDGRIRANGRNVITFGPESKLVNFPDTGYPAP